MTNLELTLTMCLVFIAGIVAQKLAHFLWEIGK